MRRMRHLKPREIQGCKLALDASISTSLYDATSGGSLVSADGTVKRWEDQSGNGNHVTESTNGPQRKINTMNGRDTLYFDGVDDKLTQATAGESKFLHVAQGATFAAVAHFGVVSNPAATYVLIDGHGTTYAKVGASVYYDDEARNNGLTCQVALAAGGAGSFVSQTIPADKITPNTPTTMTIAMDNGNATASARQYISINGATEYGGNSQNFTASTADPTHPLRVGCLASSSALLMLGYISEINGWDNVLNIAVRKRFNNSRQRKWVISG